MSRRSNNPDDIGNTPRAHSSTLADSITSPTERAHDREEAMMKLRDRREAKITILPDNRAEILARKPKIGSKTSRRRASTMNPPTERQRQQRPR